jgi:hypothetical protein
MGEPITKSGVLLPAAVYREVLRLTEGIQQSVAKYEAIDNLHAFARFVLNAAKDDKHHGDGDEARKLADNIEQNGLCNDPLYPKETRQLIVAALRAYVSPSAAEKPVLLVAEDSNIGAAAIARLLQDEGEAYEGPCELPECKHRLCACGHSECDHADENVQPNCSDCECSGFSVAHSSTVLTHTTWLAEDLLDQTLCVKVINPEHGNYWRCPICDGKNEHKPECIVMSAANELRRVASSTAEIEKLIGMTLRGSPAAAERLRELLRTPSATARDTERLDDIEQTKCYPFWNGDRWIYIVAPERSTKATRRGEGKTAREAIDAARAAPTGKKQ